jgi:hypothetical protein
MMKFLMNFNVFFIFLLRLICFGRREKRDCVSDFLCDVATILWLCDDLAPFID